MPRQSLPMYTPVTPSCESMPASSSECQRATPPAHFRVWYHSLSEHGKRNPPMTPSFKDQNPEICTVRWYVLIRLTPTSTVNNERHATSSPSAT